MLKLILSMKEVKSHLSFKRNCDGVNPVNFLKATLKEERVLNPQSNAMLAIVKFFISGLANNFFASSTLYELIKSLKIAGKLFINDLG